LPSGQLPLPWGRPDDLPSLRRPVAQRKSGLLALQLSVPHFAKLGLPQLQMALAGSFRPFWQRTLMQVRQPRVNA
jgi:hypothetical protein